MANILYFPSPLFANREPVKPHDLTFVPNGLLRPRLTSGVSAREDRAQNNMQERREGGGLRRGRSDVAVF